MKTDSLLKEPAAVLKSANYLAATADVLTRLDSELIDRISEQIWQAYTRGSTVYLFGNGGSAALASHIACDLVKGTVAKGQQRFRAVSLNDNISLLTALANDIAYEEIFAEQLQDVIQAGDIVFAISSSGNSRNVVRGLEVARKSGATTITITGFAGGKVKSLSDLCLVVPSDNVQYIEDAHLGATHAIFTAIRHRMQHAADRE